MPVLFFWQIRMFQRDSRDRTVLQPNPAAAIDVCHLTLAIINIISLSKYNVILFTHCFLLSNLPHWVGNGTLTLFYPPWGLLLISFIFLVCWSLIQMLPSVAYLDNPSTSFAAKFVHTSLNKNRCSINRVLVSWRKPQVHLSICSHEYKL